jgi:hypothetical protein
MNWLEKNWVIVLVVFLAYLYFSGKLATIVAATPLSASPLASLA